MYFSVCAVANIWAILSLSPKFNHNASKDTFQGISVGSLRGRGSILIIMKQGKAPYIPVEVLERTVAAQKGHHATRNKTILLLSHYMGLRAKELSLLRVGDVFDSHAGKVKEVIRLLASMTKGERFREVFLVNESARENVRLYLIERGMRSLEAPLFLSQKGGAFSPNTMQRLLRDIYLAANVKASSHSGRRSFATRLIESGADIYSVKELLGHSSIVTTQAYFATSPERLKRLVGVLR